MTPHQWHEHLTGRLRVTIGYAEFCEAWNRALDPEPILEEALFEKLGKRYRLALLSNTDPLHSAHLESHFAFVKHFPVRIYSCRVGASKPSPAIYAAALDALGVRSGGSPIYRRYRRVCRGRAAAWTRCHLLREPCATPGTTVQPRPLADDPSDDDESCGNKTPVHPRY